MKSKPTDQQWANWERKSQIKNRCFYKTAERLGNNVPINSNAKRFLSKPRQKGYIPKNQVYIVHFRHRKKPQEHFIKVGITHNDVNERFQEDVKQYNIDIIFESKYMSKRDATLFESAILTLYKHKRYRPTILLASGNGECLEYSQDLVNQIKNIIKPL